tara:strand:+ start:59 stop:778 length:720 start_codon:yes stop_codon:yes gene_type:complete
MEKSKKLKIFIGLFYLILLLSFLIIFFSKYSFEEVKSYSFIQQNRDYFFNLKEANLILISFLFFISIIIWVFFAGFGSPIALIGGFIFGKFLGTLIVVLGLTFGSTFLYIFANYFLRDLIKEKFLFKFQNLESKFKKNEFNYFLLYRFIGGIPFVIANLLPVIFNIKIKNYFIGTFLGIIPQIFILTSLGSGLDKIIEQNETAPGIIDLLFLPEIYIPVLAFFFIVLVTIIIRKFFYKN